MIYTVGEMAQKLGVPASTLRYYDKEGLLPFVERSSGGIRMFRENDFEWLQVIRCMKKAGMSIKDIRQYIKKSSPLSPFGRWEKCMVWSPTAMAWCAVRSILTATPA